MDVACVRCGRTLPIEQADVVGNGYRCEACTIHVQHEGGEEADVADNVDPTTREQLAKQGKRRFFATMGTAGALTAVPVGIAFAIAGPVAAIGAGILAVAIGSSTAISLSGLHLEQWRRYKQPPLPKAKLRK